LDFGNELIITSEEVKQSRLLSLLLPPIVLQRENCGSWVFIFQVNAGEKENQKK
jgi:hypothetical protein